MSETNRAARSDGDEEQVSGAEVIAQALKTQVRWTLLRKPAGGAETLSWRQGERCGGRWGGFP